mgnify:CR=1 FL=1
MIKRSAQLKWLAGFIALLWVAEGINWFTDGSLRIYGLIPRHPDLLYGIVTAPFLHGSVEHLLGNTVPLALLGILIIQLRPLAFVTCFVILLSGLLVWLFGRMSIHIGASGVVMSTVKIIEDMLAKGVTPVIPSQGSVGASGDLAPLAHMAAAMIGEGEAMFEGVRMSAADALQKAGLTPIILGAKEGLALINGTQFSTACALVGLWGAWQNAATSVLTCALSTDAIMGSTAPLQDAIHTLRGHAGQIAVARAQRALMAGSEIRESHVDGDTRVQDPYCIRCQPQVTGAAMDVLHFAARTLEVEANAVTDNPLVLVEDDLIVSGGNFHAEPVGFAADQIAVAISEIGAIAQRRVALMVDPTLSFDLPPFLTPDPGLNSGLMIAEVTTAALMSENKHLANPCTTDSTPTSANQEDHVSMAAHAARRLVRMNANLNVILGVEAMCGAQGIEFRAPLKTSAALTGAMATLRGEVATLQDDRYMAPSIEAAGAMVASGALSGSVTLPAYVKGHAQ